MESIFGTESEDLLLTVKNALRKESIKDNDKLEIMLEDAFFKMKLMSYAVNETMILALTNRAGQIIYVNDRFVEISGYSPEELIGKTHRVVKSSHHSTKFFKEMWNTILQGQTWEGEICNKRKNGELYWVKTYILPIGEEYKDTYFLSIRTDITVEKEKEQRLQANLLNSFETVVRHVNNLIFRVDKDYNNESYFSLLTGKIATEYFKERGIQAIHPSSEMFGEQPFQSLKLAMSYFPKEVSDKLNENITKVFLGEEVAYKEWFGSKCIHITISPIEQNGKVTGAIGIGNDITELENTRTTLSELAYKDHLTNTYNTAALNRDIQLKILLKEPFSFLYIDLDRFKNINDSLGHVTGDILLQKVSRRMKSFYKEGAQIYRMGGDEFVILLDDQEFPCKNYLLNAQQLIKEIEKPFYIDEMELYISCSIGLSCFPLHGSEYAALHRAADLALNVSKEQGRGTAVLYEKNLEEGYINKVRLESDIRFGLENDEFFLVYQPKVNLFTNKVHGYEALIRWNRKGKNIIPPNDYIPFAEETGLIIPLGRYVLHEACRQAAEWLQKGIAFDTVSVNISPAELEQNDFVNNVKDILLETGLPPQYLELEITENVLMKNLNKLLSILTELKNYGIRIAMDDFGAGFSNFRYLSELPIHTLKIDSMFMNRIFERRNEVIVSSIIRIGLSLGLEVVAEGVETEEVIQFLKRHKCKIVQGYYYSKPLNARDVPDFNLMVK
ncbi:EAL domain-containing protein [Psychrobacillus sp. FSL K6-2684]|uniref:sensor domain-containing protein n=1 Tax=unclassified Psychrobacillus TaxID=2636677 RepID=UPI001243B68E|nr:EAL domain-containing protein [Psychrobacillus sp. AK 1817]QEY20390.1 EAL domain-containing protein [Psychrobacillus sp. AK 1817]